METRGREGEDKNSIFTPAIEQLEKNIKMYHNQPPKQRRLAQ
jgi:hypothetical protein